MKQYSASEVAKMLGKTRRDMQVSKNDNRSKMGKYFRDIRAERKEIIKRDREFKKNKQL
jgi:hypothetical protein